MSHGSDFQRDGQIRLSSELAVHVEVERVVRWTTPVVVLVDPCLVFSLLLELSAIYFRVVHGGLFQGAKTSTGTACLSILLQC